jgi:hypothetical protein
VDTSDPTTNTNGDPIESLALPPVPAAESAALRDELVRAVRPRSAIEPTVFEQMYHSALSARPSGQAHAGLQAEALRRADFNWQCDEQNNVASPPDAEPVTNHEETNAPKTGSTGVRSKSTVMAPWVLCAFAVNSLPPSALGARTAALPLPCTFTSGNFPERIRVMSGTNAEQIKSTTSQKRIDANRINASRSTGPRTEAGKNISKYNNLTHGRCARTLVVLPDECAETVTREAQEMVQALDAVGPAEERIALAYAGCFQSFQRGQTAEGGALNLAQNAVREQAAEGQQAEVSRLGGLLVAGTDLETTIDQLKRTSTGCSYLLSQFNIIDEHLSIFDGLSPVQRVLAIHLLGRRPCDWFRDGVVRDWTYAYVFAYYGDRPFDGESVAALLHADRPERMSPSEYLHHVNHLIETALSADEANAVLRKLVAAQIKELTDLRDLRKFQEARDLEDKIDKARVDDSPEGRNRQQNMAAAVRHMKALRIELEAMQAQRRERGGEPAAPEAAQDVPGESEPNAAAAPKPAGGSPEPVLPAPPAVLATVGTLALVAWEVVRRLLE